MNRWIYDAERGQLFAKCEECKKKVEMGRYKYVNDFKYCPYCGNPKEAGDYKLARAKAFGVKE